MLCHIIGSWEWNTNYCASSPQYHLFLARVSLSRLQPLLQFSTTECGMGAAPGWDVAQHNINNVVDVICAAA